MSLLKAISGYLPGLALFAALTLMAVFLYNFRRRKRAEKGLEESERRFDLLMQHVKDYAIFMIDPRGNVMTWNEGAEQIKGYKAEEVIGAPISIFYTDEDNARGEPEDNLRIAAALGSYECVGIRKRKDGTWLYADVVYTCMRNQRQEITGYVKITKDISEQRRAEEEMRLSLQKERELNEMKSRFVTLASHEFKTPLSVILSSTIFPGPGYYSFYAAVPAGCRASPDHGSWHRHTTGGAGTSLRAIFPRYQHRGHPGYRSGAQHRQKVFGPDGWYNHRIQRTNAGDHFYDHPACCQGYDIYQLRVLLPSCDPLFPTAIFGVLKCKNHVGKINHAGNRTTAQQRSSWPYRMYGR